MIQVDFIHEVNFLSFHASGHALFSPGNDIVCSAVSALAYALLGTLENIPGVLVKKDISDGRMDIGISPIEDKDKEAVYKVTNTVFSTVCIGLKQVAKSYPDHVRVRVLTNHKGKLSKSSKIK